MQVNISQRSSGFRSSCNVPAVPVLQRFCQARRKHERRAAHVSPLQVAHVNGTPAVPGANGVSNANASVRPGGASEASPSTQSSMTANLLLQCPDQKGVIAAVSQVRWLGVEIHRTCSFFYRQFPLYSPNLALQLFGIKS